MCAFALTLAASSSAMAESTIKSDMDHPLYSLELEPHITGTPFQEGGIGGGLAGTFVIKDDGFIGRLNDSIGVGFGANWLSNRDFLFSAAMQWNFWFTEHWSAFGEPGLAIDTHDGTNFWPAFGAGGRYAFSHSTALTLRLGFPVSSLGLSLFF